MTHKHISNWMLHNPDIGDLFSFLALSLFRILPLSGSSKSVSWKVKPFETFSMSGIIGSGELLQFNQRLLVGLGSGNHSGRPPRVGALGSPSVKTLCCLSPRSPQGQAQHFNHPEKLIFWNQGQIVVVATDGGSWGRHAWISVFKTWSARSLDVAVPQ